MKERKQEDKMMEPLFPRLHVNDTDKGGPRAPPRNKMALYEQFSIPSKRFNRASSTLPLPHRNACTLALSNSSSQGYGHERNVFPPICMPHRAPAYSSERVDSQSSDGIDDNANLGKRSLKHVDSRNLNVRGSVAEFSSLHHHISKSFHEKNLDYVDDCMVPTFDQTETAMCSKKDTPVTNAVKLTSFSAKSQQRSPYATLNSVIQLSTSYDKPLEQADTSNMKPRHFWGTQNGKKPEKGLVIEEPKEKSPSTRVREESNVSKVSDDASTISLREKSLCGDIGSCQESYGNGDLSGPRTLNEIDIVENWDALQKCQRTLNMVDNSKQGDSGKGNGLLEIGEAERKDQASEASMVDPISGLEISPDDVVGLIGPKHFWKARRAIINQQRVFSIQVFELHRLIKVQKLIAGSPHLLLEGNPSLRKSPVRAPLKIPQPDYNLNSQRHAVNEKEKETDDSQKSDQKKKLPVENIARIPPLPTCEDEADRDPHCQVLETGPHPRNPPSISTAPDKPSPWSYHPPTNQWLVPVMSPSEGLIYKPYAGPCAPTGGFLAPAYGSCTPLGVPSSAGDFMNMAYGVPSSLRPPNMGVLAGAPAIAANYFPAYDLPAMNSIISTSAVKQISNVACPRPNEQIDRRSRSSWNMSHPRSEASSGCLWKFQASKDIELQGSSASSPCQRVQEEAREVPPLFPVAPAKDKLTRPSQSSSRDSKTRVIKVVPRNAMSAAESAVRIFQSLQEERQQYA